MEAFVRETLEEARKVGNPRAVALCHNALGSVLHLRGRWLEAARSLKASVELCQSFDGTLGLVLGEQRLAQIESAVGLFEVADRRLQDALAAARASDSNMVRAHSLGRLYATLALNSYEWGELAAATRYMRRGMAVQREVGECAGCDVLLYPAAVPISIARGALDEADEACRRAERIASAFRSRSWVATARYLAGMLAGAHGDWRSAAALSEEAVEMFDELGHPYDLARALEQLAQVHAHLHGKAPEELVARTAALYRDVGASFRAERVESLLTGTA